MLYDYTLKQKIAWDLQISAVELLYNVVVFV